MAPFYILHRYTLRNFLRSFSITFFVSLFALVMQFMFHYADDFIGKGAGLIPMCKLIFYASMTLVPLSLPLSILLGSLMAFGNLGERLELLSMKAAGVSLFRIMSPLIILIASISVGSYFFADKILPESQVRMWTIVFSIREKSPELNIPEGSFYGEIDGINIYTRKKEGGNLLDVVIYDISNGFDNTRIILADTGRLEMSKDKTYLLLTLKNGESFENMKGKNSENTSDNIIPYRRESFRQKSVVLDFDANFAEVSSDFLEGQYCSKNSKELEYAIDSINNRLDSLQLDNITKRKNTAYFGYMPVTDAIKGSEDSIAKFDSVSFYNRYDSLSVEHRLTVIDNAIARCNTVKGDINYEKAITDWLAQEMRIHSIEWHKKLTLAFACFIFLFIGAPLGAIIRKGGMGMPIVISTVLFILYYIIDNAGYKMAREGMWPVWEGMWLSASILLPLGIFLTYLAATDSSINGLGIIKDNIADFFKKIGKIFKHK